MNPVVISDRVSSVAPSGQNAVSPPALILIGCGAVGRLFYQPALLELSRRGELAVTALVDPAAEARTSLHSRFPGAQSVAALEQVEAPPGCLAVVASPPGMHAAHSIAAMARGWHVLCEKPMAATAGECERMAATAGETDRVLAVGHYKRFFPASARLHELCHGPALGRLLAFDFQEGGPFNWPAASPSFFVRRETPGGVLLDIGVHVLDLLLWWLGEPAALDYADDAMGGLETNALLRLSYATGTSGRVHLSRDWATRQRYHFEFERGTADWTVNQANGIQLQLAGTSLRLAGTLLNPVGDPTYTNPQCFIAQLQNVLAAMRGEEPLLSDSRAGIRAMQLIERCYARRRLLAQPWLEPGEIERAHQLSGRK